MIPPKNITGIVLAGGKSSRMGTDKGLLEWKGRPFVQHIIDALQPVVSDMIIISNSEAYNRFGPSVYPDLFLDHGPLAGVYTGLVHSETNDNIVVSCDVPLINTETFRKLIEQNEDGVDIVQLSHKSDTIPLIALYKKSCERRFLERLRQKKLTLRAAVSEMNVKTIELTDKESLVVKNINTPEELAETREADNR